MKIKYGQIGVGHAHANKIAVYRQSLVDSFEINEPEDMPLLHAMLRLKTGPQ